MSQPYDSWPAVSQPGDNPFAVRSSVSTLSVISLILGSVSPFLICLCYMSLATSLAAIIAGHVARSSIRRSAGALTGAGLALGGLILGYVTLCLTVAVLVGGIYLFQMQPSPSAPGQSAPSVASVASGDSALNDAEREIISDDEGHALGNTPEAQALAEEFAIAMEAQDQEFFTQTDAKVKLSGGQYVTWCELREDRCAFLVHVPEYRRFSGEAKEMLAKLAWKTAQEVVRETLPEDAGLAVGLKGVVLYGAVMVGRVGKSDGEATGLDSTGSDKQRLVPFFERSAESAPAAPPAAAPSDSVKPDEILLEQPDAPSPAPKTGG